MDPSPVQSSSSSSPPRSSSTFSLSSQSNFGAIAKAFQFIPIKLDSENYIFWKAQVLTTIRAFDLFSFLNKVSPPPKYVTEPGDKEAVGRMLSPKYMTWLRSDQLLLGWLFSTIDKDVLAPVF